MENKNKDLVLIVDDNPSNIQVLATIMADHGYELGIAQSAQEVYQFLKEHTPDLILLDVEMPDIDGYEVCATIKADPRYQDIPVIFLTVKNELEDIVKGFDLGAVDYMTKPFHRRELISRVKTHLSLKHSKDELTRKNKELEKALVVQKQLEEEKDQLTSELIHHRDRLESMVDMRTKELAAANKRIMNIVESITDGFVALDKEWRYIYVNNHPYFPDKLSAGDLLGKKIWDVFPKLKDSDWGKEYCRAMEERVPVHFEAIFPYDDDWYEITVYPFDDGICSFFRAITEKKKYEYEMKRLSGLDLIGQMAAGISHEIRNPMTTVKGFLQLLKSDEENKKLHNYFSLMIDELDRANLIITEFLSMGNTRSAGLQQWDLNSIIQDMAPLLQADASNQDKQVELKLTDIPSLMVNRNEIRQLILNLYRNGLEAMSPGKVITIATFKEESDVVLSVSDQGEGIKPEILEKIGTPFFSTKNNGTGLGLGICYGIAARHKAKIEIQTGPEGTTFLVKFEV